MASGFVKALRWAKVGMATVWTDRLEHHKINLMGRGEDNFYLKIIELILL